MTNKSTSRQHCLVGPGARRPTTSNSRKRNKATARARQIERQEAIQIALATKA